MINETIIFMYDNVECTGTGDLFTKNDEKDIVQSYFTWKNLNEVYTNYSTRRANFPELLSEGLTSLLFGWYRTNNSNISGLSSSSMDLIAINDDNEGITIQLKACSTDGVHEPGPTSFGPKSKFDKLVFMHMDCEIDTAYWYEFDAEEYKNWKVNESETMAEQQARGLRPRIALLKKVKDDNLKPILTYTFDKNAI